MLALTDTAKWVFCISSVALIFVGVALVMFGTGGRRR